MGKIYQFASKIKLNLRYVTAALAILAIFLISRNFPAKIITSDKCSGGECPTMLDNPALSDKTPIFFKNDAFKSIPGRYYHLTFLAKANKNSHLGIKATNPSDRDKTIGDIKLEKSSEFSFHEVVFDADDDFSDIAFEKIINDDGADISINRVLVTELDIKNKTELSLLKPTIRGENSTDLRDRAQLDDGHFFNQLKEPDLILGQIFRPEEEYIASVILDIDIIKQDNNGGKKYKFELREAEYEGGVPEITSHVLSSVDFTVNDIEKYRQADGKFRFPVFSKLDPEKYYFIGINNNNVSVDRFNYLRLKGTEERGKYPDGTLAIKTKGKTYSSVGHLYFETYRLDFARYQEKNLLGGEIVENVGKNQGLFTYMPIGNIYDLADLESRSPDVSYDYGRGIIFGDTKKEPESFILYKFNTIFPAERINLKGIQPSISWNPINADYPCDGQNWKDIPSATDISTDSLVDELQKFDHSWDANCPKSNEFYIRIKSQDGMDGDKYGIDDLRVEAQLMMN